tara:strand:- start:33193 stop:33777 length:585 start_codon:yes stop_codon:yes gene_type:complete
MTLKKKSFDIKKAINGQYVMTLDLIIEVKKGEILGDIYETSHYKEIVALHNVEKEIIKELEEGSKSFRSSMVVVMNKIQNRLNQNDMYLRHKNLAWLQVKVQMAPITTTGTTVTAFIAPPLAPVMAVALTFVNYTPTMAILAIEAGIRLKPYAKRLKEFASLKARVAKLKIPVPRTIFNEPPVAESNQPQIQPA